MLGLFVYGGVTLNSFDRFIDESTGKDPEESSKSIYTVIVKKEDPLQSSLQVSNMVIGYEEKTKLDIAASLLPNNIGAGANSYKDYPTLAGALLEGKERIIVFDEAFRGIIEEVYPGFLQKTRVLSSTDQDYVRNLYASEINKPINESTSTTTTAPTTETSSTSTTNSTSTEPIETTIEVNPDSTNSTEEVVGDEGYEGSLETLPAEEVKEPELGNYQHLLKLYADLQLPFCQKASNMLLFLA